MPDYSDIHTYNVFFTANTLARSVTRIAGEEFSCTELSPSHALMLMVVARNEGATQKELGEVLVLAPSTITRFVDALERRGLLKRRSMGKSMRVSITGEGLALIPRIEAAWQAFNLRYVKALGANESEQLNGQMAHAARKLTGVPS